MKLFRLSGPLAIRFMFAICMLLLLSATADAGIFKRFKERRAGSCSGPQCASGTQCSTGNCAAPKQSVTLSSNCTSGQCASGTQCSSGNCAAGCPCPTTNNFNGRRFVFPAK